MFHKTHHSLKTLVVLTGLLSASAGWAATTNNAPGAGCVATGTGGLTVRDDGEAENRTASTVTAICPAERPVGTDITKILGGTVFVVDQNPTYDVCCRAVSKNPGGTKVIGSWQCSSGTSSSYQILELATLNDPYSWSAFFVECQLPPSSNGLFSRIQMYRVNQQ